MNAVLLPFRNVKLQFVNCTLKISLKEKNPLNTNLSLFLIFLMIKLLNKIMYDKIFNMQLLSCFMESVKGPGRPWLAI